MAIKKGQGGRPLGSTTRRGGAPKAATPKNPSQKRTPSATSKKKNWLTDNNNANLKKVLGAAENIAALGAGNPPSASVNGASNGAKDVATGEGKSTENGSANDNDTNYGGY